METKWKLPRSLSTFLVLFFTVSLLISIAGIIFHEIVQGTTYLAKHAPAYFKELIHYFQSLLNDTLFPMYDKLLIIFNSLDDSYRITLEQYIAQLLESIATSGANFLHDILSIIPTFLTVLPQSIGILFVIVIGTFLITKDWNKWKKWFMSIPYEIQLSHYLLHIKQAFIGFFKAQFILALLSGVMIFIGLTLFKVNHGLTIAVVAILIDFIPYVGMGLLFIPWIVYLFFFQYYEMTIQLTILYIVLIVIRQLLEPKILSSNLGVHPLFALIVLFTGYKLWGLNGIIFTPIIIIIIGGCYQAGLFKQIIDFIKG